MEKYPGRYLGGGPLVHSAGGISGGLCLLAEPAAGIAFAAVWLLLGLWLLLVVLPTWRVRMTPRELEVSVGVLFPVLHRMPRLTVCGLQRVTTPVLRRAGLCLAWVHGAGGQTCLLPLLPAEDLDALCRALGL